MKHDRNQFVIDPSFSKDVPVSDLISDVRAALTVPPKRSRQAPYSSPSQPYGIDQIGPNTISNASGVSPQKVMAGSTPGHAIGPARKAGHPQSHAGRHLPGPLGPLPAPASQTAVASALQTSPSGSTPSADEAAFPDLIRLSEHTNPRGAIPARRCIGGCANCPARKHSGTVFAPEKTTETTTKARVDTKT